VFLFVRWPVASLTAILVAVLSILWSGAAHAHAGLLESSPTDSQVLAQAPDQIFLRFNEPVQVTSLRLVDPTGDVVQLRPEPDGQSDRVTAALPELSSGTHVLSWRLASADGHPLGGSLVFSVGAPSGNPSGSAGPVTESVPVGLTVLYAAARVVTYGASLLTAGLVIFALLFRRHAAVASPYLAVLLSSSIAAVSTVLGLGLQALILEGDAAFLAPSSFSTFLAPGTAVSALLRLDGLALLLAAAAWQWSLPVLGPLGAVTVAASFAFTGHTVPWDSLWLSGLLVLHLLAIAFWAGAFWPLLVATRHSDRNGVAQLMAAFSVMATIVVPLLVGAGLVMAWRLVGSWSALTTTAYGLTLLAKILIVAGMLSLAALNKWRFVPALQQGKDALERLRRSILGEAALAGVVFIATAVLTSVPPPAGGNTAEHIRHGFNSNQIIHTSAGSLKLMLTVTPVDAGENAIELKVSGSDGAAIDIQSVTLNLGSPDLGIEKILRVMTRTGVGSYRHDGPELAVPGRWRIGADLLVSDFEKRTAEFIIDIEGNHGLR
jgi:copper transport protein